jgi:4-diphosphocytidyl-2-C-methyl-D-erythritol kinase
MVAVGLYDTLVFKDEPGGDVRLRCTLPDLSTGPDNLVVRAARLLQEHTGCRRGVQVRLVKRIPLAAGLAGGSTDAAAALAGLNRLWSLGLADSELARLGARIGSDVPFFFATPAAWCTGRGELVSPVPLGTTLHLVLLCPPFGLATAAVYREVVVPNHPDDGAAVRQAITAGRIDDLGRLLRNRLQEPAFRMCPALARYQAQLAGLKPAGVLMSGSGTSLFALCRSRADARQIARHLRAAHGKGGSSPWTEEGSGEEASGTRLGSAGYGRDEGEAHVFLVRSCS